MAKNLITVASLLSSYVITGIERDEKAQEAFINYCASEYGALSDDNKESFAGIKLSGKGDKAKGKLNRGTIEFKGGHNTALVVLAAASAIYDLESSINRVVGKVDCSEVVKSWHERWLAKQSVTTVDG